MAEETCKCGHGNPPIAKAGPYRGLCEIGREVKREELSITHKKTRARRNGEPEPKPPIRGFVPDGKTGLEEKDRAEGSVRVPKLADTIEDVLLPAAHNLETSLTEREEASRSARVRVIEFNDALKVVGRVAQSLVNSSNAKKDSPREIEV